MIRRVFYCSIVLVVVVLVLVMVTSRRTQKLAVPRQFTQVNDTSLTLTNDIFSTLLPTSTQPTRSTIASTDSSQLFKSALLRTDSEILSARWVMDLKHILSLPKTGKQVSAIFGNYDYLESVLNWLIAAQVRLEPPLTDIIVFCLDARTHDVLSQRNIPSVYVDQSTVFQSSAVYFWITRLVVFRLVNYFGHDVMAFDSDAIVLKNPRELLKKHELSDIVGSAGTYPQDLGRQWKFTVCMGVILFRSTPRTDVIWDWLFKKRHSKNDDQYLLNHALNSCHIHWQSKDKAINSRAIEGKCDSGPKVTVLPYNVICRTQCNTNVYVWHKLTSKKGGSKKQVAKAGKVWFLRSDWETRSNTTAKGVEWLCSISSTGC